MVGSGRKGNHDNTGSFTTVFGARPTHHRHPASMEADAKMRRLALYVLTILFVVYLPLVNRPAPQIGTPVARGYGDNPPCVG